MKAFHSSILAGVALAALALGTSAYADPSDAHHPRSRLVFGGGHAFGTGTYGHVGEWYPYGGWYGGSGAEGGPVYYGFGPNSYVYDPGNTPAETTPPITIEYGGHGNQWREYHWQHHRHHRHHAKE